jgi:hypothetical protein
MSSFSATDAAFEGFRITREKPRVLLIWAGFYLIVSFLMPILMVTLGGQDLSALESAANDPNVDATAALKNLAALGPLYSFLIPLGLAVQAMMAAAVYRVVLRPSDAGFGYLRLGADEWRLVCLTFIYVVMTMLLVFAVALVAGVAAAMTAAVSPAAGAFAGVALGLFALGLLVFIGVRLSLAPAITFAERRLAIFDSWALTHGKFWPLLGVYILALASVVVVLLLAMIIFTAVAAIVLGGDIAAVGALFKPDLSSIKAYFTPPMIAYTVFGALMNSIYYAVLIAPAAVVYKALSGRAVEA